MLIKIKHIVYIQNCFFYFNMLFFNGVTLYNIGVLRFVMWKGYGK